MAQVKRPNDNGSDGDTLELSDIASESVGSWSYFGKLFDVVLYIWPNTYPLTQQFHLKYIRNSEVCKSVPKHMHKNYYSSVIFNSSKLEI